MDRKGFKTDPGRTSELRKLERPSTFASLVAFDHDWGLIAGAIGVSLTTSLRYGAAISWLVYAIAVLVIAFGMRALENLHHEGTHVHLSPNRRLNDFLTWAIALPLAHNPITERRGHLGGHHSAFWDLHRDPDRRRYRANGWDSLPCSSITELLSILAWGYGPYVLGTVRNFFWPSGELIQHRVVRVGFWLGIVALFAYMRFLPVLVYYWVVPWLVLMSIRYVAELSKHAGMSCSSEFTTTRNNLGWAQRWFVHPHHDGYHLVHHLYPRIPFHNLPRAHALLMGDPIYCSQGRHCYGLISALSGRRTTLADLLGR